MRDFLKRLVIVGIMALFISLLFIGGKQPQADGLDLEDRTAHWIWPTDGVVSDTYGTRNGHHNGIDIAGEYNSPVYAVDGGVVTKSYYSGSYGNVVFIKHSNGLETVYAHLGSRLVEEDQVIKQGEILGRMGSTGHSSGVHLHFEVHENGWTVHKENALNPEKVFENVAIGETVQAVIKEQKRVAGVAESNEKEPRTEVKGINNAVEKAESSFSFEPVVKQQVKNNSAINGDTQIASALDVVAKVSSLNRMNFLLYSDFLLLKDGRFAAVYNNEVKAEKEDSIEKSMPEEKKELVHIVQRGESLWDIAEQYNTSYSRIMEMNQLENELIFPEQSLVIEIDMDGKYIVQPGDNLTTIAQKHDQSIDHIMAINQLNSDLIHPQQVLIIDG